MNDNKKNRLKGSVLYTVIAVMMIMTVFVFAALTLAASANKRAHNVYANNQTQYTARSVVDGMMAILEQNGKDAVGTVDVDKLNASLDSSWGKVTAASIQDVGSIKDLENKGINFGLNLTTSQKTERRVYKLSATVNMQGQENTVALYCYDGEEDKPYLFTNALTSMGEMPLDTHLFPYPIEGDMYVNINGLAPPTIDNGVTYDKHTNIINFDLDLNGSYGMKQGNMLLFQSADIKINDLHKGIYIGGSMVQPVNGHHFNLNLTKDIQNVSYKSLPYAYFEDTIYDKITAHENGIDKDITTGGENEINIGDANHPFIVMADALDCREGNEGILYSNKFNAYGDIYLYSNTKPSYISAREGSGINSWNPGKIKDVCASGSNYNGGNIFSLGEINVGTVNAIESDYFANNIIVNKINFFGKQSGSDLKYNTTGAVVAKNVNLSQGINVSKSENLGYFNFNNGLFTDPSTFIIAENQVVNGIVCDHTKTLYYNSANITKIISDTNSDGNYYWNKDGMHTNEIHNFEFNLNDIAQYDLTKNIYAVPKSVEIEWEPMSENADITKISFYNALYEKEKLDWYASCNESNSIEFNNPERTLTIPLSYFKPTSDGKMKAYNEMKFKLANIEGGHWERVRWIGDYYNGHWEHFHKVFTNPSNPWEFNWEKDSDYNEPTRWVSDNFGGHFEHWVVDTTIRVKSVKLNVDIYENIKDFNNEDAINYLKKVNDVSFNNPDNSNGIYIDDIDKSVKLEKTIDSTTGRTVMNISMAKTGESTYTLQNSYDYENAYSDFLRAVVNTVTFPESMNTMQKVLDTEGGFVDTSFMSDGNKDKIYNRTKSYDEITELKDAKTYCVGNNNYYCIIDKDGKCEQVVVEEATEYSPAKYNKVVRQFTESNPIKENCIITSEGCAWSTIFIDPGDSELNIALIGIELNNAHIVVKNNGNGKGRVNFIIPKAGTLYKTTSVGIYGEIWDTSVKTHDLEHGNASDGIFKINTATILTDTFYNQWKTNGIIEIKSKPTDKKDIPNIYIYLDSADSNCSIDMYQSLVSAYILAPYHNVVVRGSYSTSNAVGVGALPKFKYDGNPMANADGTNCETLIGSAIAKKYQSLTNTTFSFIDERGAVSDENKGNVGKFTKLYYQAY